MNDFNKEEKDFYLYLIHFSNGRIKIGVTGNLKKRLSYYQQEANRHGFKISEKEHHLILCGKKIALNFESIICREYKNAAIKKHREWFKGNYLLFIFIASRVQQLTIYDSSEFFNTDRMMNDPFMNKEFSFPRYQSLAA